MGKLIIVGTGMNARHALEFIRFYNLYDVIGFAVDREYIVDREYLGLPVFAIDELGDIVKKEDVKFFVAVFWNKLNADRRHLYEKIKGLGYHCANLISPTAVVHGHLEGENCWLHDCVIVNTDAHIGNDVMIMGRAFVGQDSIIEDHCFIAAGSMIASCHIGEQSFIGLSATLFDGVKIGKKCLVGATCSVKRNMLDYSLCKVSSDSVVTKQYDENTIEEKLMFKKNVR